MDGYDRIVYPGDKHWTYRVYTFTGRIKHYHYGYSSYKLMLSKHPELVG